MILNSFDIAQNIRLVRETKGLTIEKLAELAGVSANHMSKVENGLRNLSMESYLNVLQALDVYPVFLAGTDDGEDTKKYISDFVEIIKDCSGREVTFLLNMAVSMKENMIKTGLTAREKNNWIMICYEHDIFGINGEQDERIHILVAHSFSN